MKEALSERPEFNILISCMYGRLGSDYQLLEETSCELLTTILCTLEWTHSEAAP